jgi:hypothetical protein
MIKQVKDVSEILCKVLFALLFLLVMPLVLLYEHLFTDTYKIDEKKNETNRTS